MSTATRPAPARYVEHVMGMPISLALRGRHTDDAAARGAWAEALAALRDVDRVFSTYRPDSFVSRLARAEIAIEDCPPEVAEVLALGEVARLQSHGAFDVRRGGVLDPSGVVKGWAVERAARPLRALPETDVCLSAGGDLVCQVAGPDSPDWRIGIEDPHDPTPRGRGGAGAHRCGRHLRAWPTAAVMSSTPAPAPSPTGSPRSPSSTTT